MYCRICGSKTDNEDNICSNCDSISRKVKETKTENKSHSIYVLVVTFLIIFVVVVGSCLVRLGNGVSISGGNKDNSDGKYKLFSRSATLNDIIIDSKIDFNALGEEFVIYPQNNIKGLKITIAFLDEGKEELTSVSKFLGDVEKSKQVSFTISFLELDLSLSSILEITYDRCIVSGGTVSYFS